MTTGSILPPARYIGLDIHKHYLVAHGVDKEQNHVYGPRRIDNGKIRTWLKKDITIQDAVALEMTTNTWHLVDMLEPHVHSILVVHPPEVKSIVKARVMTDKKAAKILASLHAARLLPPVWIPPQEVRQIRSLVAGRRRMVSMGVRAKNSLHAILHSKHISAPAGDLFHPDQQAWWENPCPSLPGRKLGCWPNWTACLLPLARKPGTKRR